MIVINNLCHYYYHYYNIITIGISIKLANVTIQPINLN